MKEQDIPTIPQDQVSFSKNSFIGIYYVLKGDPGSLVIDGVKFESVKDRPLSDFSYNKPPVNRTNLFQKPNPEDYKMDIRKGYYPVKIVHGVRRPPNHLHQPEDAIIAVFNANKEKGVPKWESRFFPRSCINEETWLESLNILGVKD